MLEDGPVDVLTGFVDRPDQAKSRDGCTSLCSATEHREPLCAGACEILGEDVGGRPKGCGGDGDQRLPAECLGADAGDDDGTSEAHQCRADAGA